ncbi:CrpP-related protein [Neorhizobium petrolearium]|uniref:CrpP-related protein n=1 Tax=Neorhizobium petrolearium TaxID=515361 RepID=UPI003F803308
MVSVEVIVELQERGAEARARGAGWEENPFLRIVALLGTFDPTNHWEEKRQAWQFGWAIENAYRIAYFDDRVS